MNAKQVRGELERLLNDLRNGYITTAQARVRIAALTAILEALRLEMCVTGCKVKE